MRKEGNITILSIQERFPWLMAPVELANILVTPERWSCLFDRFASQITDAIVVDTTGLGRVLTQRTARLSPVR